MTIEEEVLRELKEKINEKEKPFTYRRHKDMKILKSNFVEQILMKELDYLFGVNEWLKGQEKPDWDRKDMRKFVKEVGKKIMLKVNKAIDLTTQKTLEKVEKLVNNCVSRDPEVNEKLKRIGETEPIALMTKENGRWIRKSEVLELLKKLKEAEK